MGLASQSEMDDAVIKAKQKLQDEEVLDVLKGCTIGGPMVSQSQYKRILVQKGGDLEQWQNQPLNS